MNITPRQKAIIVGGLFGGSLSINSQTMQLEVVSKVNEYFDAWLQSELTCVLRNRDRDPFLAKVHSKLYKENKDFSIPTDYVQRMSPLAIAVWFISSSLRGIDGFLVSDKTALPTIQDVFRTKWGIETSTNDMWLNLSSVKLASENDAINLWLLTKNHIQLAYPELSSIKQAIFPRKFKTIYLSGGQQFCANGGINWRAKVSPALYAAGFDIFNPVYEEGSVSDIYGVNIDQLKQENFDDYMKVGRRFVDADYAAISRSHIVLAYWNKATEMGGGTKSEITWAYKNMNIPVYLVLDEGYCIENLPIWSLGCIDSKDYVFELNNFDGAIKEIIGRFQC